ncbi:M1 family metallopeptidase [Cellulomonas marina]|uniref:Aminopeptidase N n=1 Tax=Cellulomonas marina TaxID=988821 RepID=A0A1I0ZB71_9CELL|nr:M1 family metallopeptidase [Cellulomonas marina]GIG30614.1 putative peptidase M1, membrane alanine aminopeptidase [Cellulomonas marina]SFB22771.1 Peptidase family M1 [Cellulomonas marina]
MTPPARGAAPGARPTDPYDPTGDPDLHVEHYDLDLTYKVARNRLGGTAVLHLRPLVATREVHLELAGLVVQEVAVEGARLARHRHRGRALTLRLADEVPAGAPLVVTVRYAGTPGPVPSPFGPVGWEELTDGALVASQPHGAASWFPCNDRPGDRATFRTRLTVDDPYRVAAPGRLTGRRARAGATTWVFEETAPTATYLATVQVGRYAELALADAPVPQRALVPPAHLPAARRALARHGDMLDALADVFGPYPFDGYTLVVADDVLEIPVEAQGMSVFGTNHLGGTSDDERLVAHELAHQWVGNGVGISTWQHLWLNEGFACYAEWLWSEASGGPDVGTLAGRWRARLAARPQDLVLSDPGPERVFDDRVYKRGALTVHALRLVLGERCWRETVRAWVAEHVGGPTVTDADFRAHVARFAHGQGGEDLAARVADLLRRWLDEEPLPELPGSSDRVA